MKEELIRCTYIYN